MTCRDEILECANQIVQKKNVNEFSLEEIVECMELAGTNYKESTIRTHVASRMCVNAPKHHATKFDDFERISHGIYKLKN